MRDVCVILAALVVLAAPAIAHGDEPLAGQAGDEPSPPRIALGAGMQAGTLLRRAGPEPFTPGASGGVEVALTERLALVAEVTWTSGYELSPGVRHDRFLYFEGKVRWLLSGSRHPPYLLAGVAYIRDHDTVVSPYRPLAGQWAYGPANPEARSRTAAAIGGVVGFGQALRIADRLELRPEAQLYLGTASFLRVGAGVWYAF